jgi:hypothetical protein
MLLWKSYTINSQGKAWLPENKNGRITEYNFFYITTVEDRIFGNL